MDHFTYKCYTHQVGDMNGVIVIDCKEEYLRSKAESDEDRENITLFKQSVLPVLAHYDELQRLRYVSTWWHDEHNGLVKVCSNSSGLAMELLQLCVKPSRWGQEFSCQFSCQCVLMLFFQEIVAPCLCNLDISFNVNFNNCWIFLHTDNGCDLDLRWLWTWSAMIMTLTFDLDHCRLLGNARRRRF